MYDIDIVVCADIDIDIYVVTPADIDTNIDIAARANIHSKHGNKITLSSKECIKWFKIITFVTYQRLVVLFHQF